MLKIVLLIFMVGFVSAVDVELSCPDEVFVDEEFGCSLEVFDGDGVYDLKVEIDSERNSVLRILDGGDWKSSYYYLKEFVRDEAVVKLKVSEVGRYDLVVKLRQDSDRSEFDVGRIQVLGKEKSVDASVSSKEVVIALGGDVVVEEEWDYVSKDGQIVDWLLYGFCLFLILLVGVLVWGR